MVEEFTIRIPDWDDIIHIRPFSTYPPEVRRAKVIERVTALRKSPTPGIIQRLSQIANYIDDAEDILSTALVLAKPLLRRLPGRLIPGLGWVLLAKDILDFGTWVLSSATPGMGGKRRAIDQVRSVSFSRGNRMRKLERFARMKPGVPAILEGLQAADTLFGVGLSLGPLMGLIQDTIWGTMRNAGGARVQFTSSTPVTMHDKANRFLMQNPMMMGYAAGMQLADAQKVMAAQEYANVWSQQANRSDDVLNMVHDASTFALPQMVPHDPLTREVLKDQGIDPDRLEPAPGPFGVGEAPTLNAVIDATLEVFPDSWKQIKERFKGDPAAEFSAMGGISSAEQIATWVEQMPLGSEWSPNLGDMVPIGMIEMGKGVAPGQKPDVIAAFIERIAVGIYLDAGLDPSGWGRSDNPLKDDWGLDPMPKPTQDWIDSSARIFGVQVINIQN